MSSTVALMLSENPALGYRDVQEILALSAVSRTAGNTSANGAQFFNGGGLMFDREGGFGRLDAEAAVNLARNWTARSTAANEVALSAAFDTGVTPDRTFAAFETTLSPEDGRAFSIDRVELEVSLFDRGLKDLAITLTSPDGTQTAIAESMKYVGSRTTLNFTFGSVANWGEDAFGTWRVEFSHSTASSTFMTFGVSLHVYGDYDTADDTYYVTGSFADLVALDPARSTFRDDDGGSDTLNFAAARSAAFIDLAGESASSNAGIGITLAGRFENVVGSTHDDALRGSADANRLVGDYGNDILDGRDGDDLLLGGAGDDTLIGGHGNDTIDGGDGYDTVVFSGSFADYVIVQAGSGYHVTAIDGSVDMVSNVELFAFFGHDVDVLSNASAILRAEAPEIVSVVADAGAIPGDTLTVRASELAGTRLAVITATDANLAAGDVLHYVLRTSDGGSCDDLFTVVRMSDTTAEIRLTGAPAAAGTCYDLMLEVTDLHGNKTVQALSVTVVPGNLAPTSLTLSGETVMENVAGAVVGSVSAVDDSDNEVTYALSDGRFEIVRHEGMLVLKLCDGIALDFEAEPTVSLAITVTDAGGLSLVRDVILSVSDANEAPVAIGIDAASVVEASAGAIVGRVAVEDPDAGDRHTLAVDDARFEVVTIDGNHVLKLRDCIALDYEQVRQISLTLTATDGAGLQVSHAVVVGVTNVDESPVGSGVQDAGPLQQGLTQAVLGIAPLVDPEGDVVTYTVSALPSAGTILLDGVAVAVNQVLTGAQLQRLTITVPDTATGSVQLGLVGSDPGGNPTPITVNIAFSDATDDLLVGQGSLNERFDGGAGNDTLRGGLGYDTLIGGSGADVFDFNSVAEIGMAFGSRDVIADFQQGVDLIDLADIDAHAGLAGMQHFTWVGTATHTGAGATLRYMHAGGNTLVFGDVNGDGAGDFTLQINGIRNLTAADFTDLTIDTVQGTSGNDVLLGTAGQEMLRGGLGHDTMTGGAGADVFDFNSVAEIGMNVGARDVITDFEQGVDLIDLADIDANTVLAGKQAFTFIGAAVHTGAGATLRYLHAGGNTLVFGDVNGDGAGDFTLQINGIHTLTAADFTAKSIHAIQGTNSNDVLTATASGKVLLGLGGNDTLLGGSGNDTLWGGAGADSMTGGGGADVFKWASHTHTGNSAATRDIVIDFQQGVDKLDLSGIDANVNVAGDQAFTFLGTAVHTGAGATLRYIHAGGNTLIYGDVDSDKAGDFTIQITGLYTLTAQDFVL